MLLNPFFRTRPYTLTTYPSADFENLRRQMNVFFDKPTAPRKRSTWPKATLEKLEDELVLTLALPGLSSDDVSIKTADGELTLQGTRKTENLEGYKAIRTERAPVKFLRRFRLPKRVDASGINAKMVDGLLSVRLPLRPEHKPRSIKIES